MKLQSRRNISKSSGTVLRDGPKNRPIDQTTIDPRFSSHCERITLMVRPRSSRWFSRKSSKNSNLVEIFQSPDEFQSPPAPSSGRSKNRPIDQTTIDPRFSFHCERITLMVRPRSSRWFSRKSRETPISSKYFKVLRHRPPGWSKKIVRSTRQPLIHVSRPLRTYYSDGSTAVVALVFEKIE